MSSRTKPASWVVTDRRIRRSVSRIFVADRTSSIFSGPAFGAFGDGLCASIVRIASVPMTARKLRQEKKKLAELEIAKGPEEAADEAGLRYVSDDQPGYTRKLRGKKFVYFDTEGKEIRDETRILRINRLAIPPAYHDVWICPSPNGHLQATGRDDRGRKQYRYHPAGGQPGMKRNLNG
jgi:hypothetical protein